MQPPNPHHKPVTPTQQARIPDRTAPRLEDHAKPALRLVKSDPTSPSPASKNATLQSDAMARAMAALELAKANQKDILDLEGTPGTSRATPGLPTPVATPVTEHADPRWVLAIQTASRLQGTILPPEDRQTLISMAKQFGLNAFDANLIIAVVQDQARRGIAPMDCPAASREQLSYISLPAHTSFISTLKQKPKAIGLCTLGFLSIQAVLIYRWLG